MENKRLKDRIKEVKRSLREYKKEFKEARRNEEWGAVEFLVACINRYSIELEQLEKRYRKFDDMKPIPKLPGEWGVK